MPYPARDPERRLPHDLSGKVPEPGETYSKIPRQLQTTASAMAESSTSDGKVGLYNELDESRETTTNIPSSAEVIAYTRSCGVLPYLIEDGREGKRPRNMQGLNTFNSYD